MVEPDASNPKDGKPFRPRSELLGVLQDKVMCDGVNSSNEGSACPGECGIDDFLTGVSERTECKRERL